MPRTRAREPRPRRHLGRAYADRLPGSGAGGEPTAVTAGPGRVTPAGPPAPIPTRVVTRWT